MSATIQDIAEQVGVNASTVSRALNNKSNVSENTKKRVHEAARILEYRPNRVARGLATQKTNTLGLVMPATSCLGHTLFCSMLEGVYEAVQELGYSLSFSVVDVGIQGEEAAIRKLEEHRVDGFILGWFKEKYIQEAHLLELSQRDIPFVIVGSRRLSSQSINMIACDNFLGAYGATKHLIDLGHEKIAAISSTTQGIIFSDRFAGYNAALEQAGIRYSEEVRQRYTREIDFDRPGSGEAAMRSLLDVGGDFTAVFVFGDSYAAEAIGAIQRRGYKVPDDYAVVGFDGAEYGRLLNPGLTTVEQPYHEIGKEAVQMLDRLINEGELTQRQVLIKPRLVIRESCGSQIQG